MNGLTLRELRGLRLFSTAAHVARRIGERRGRSKGGRIEFVDYRPYFRGDDLRRVDWNVAARTDRLFVKEYVREVGLPVALLIDVSRSMTVGEPSPLAAAREIARGLAYIGLVHGETVAVGGLSRSLVGFVETSSRAGLFRIERALAALDAQAEADFNRAIRTVAHRIRGTGVAIVLSDLLDPRGVDDGLRLLVARGFETAVVHLLAPTFFEPDLPPDALVTDAESGATREIAWNADTRDAYAARRDAFLASVADGCAARGIRYARVRTETPLRDVFFKGLRAAAVLV